MFNKFILAAMASLFTATASAQTASSGFYLDGNVQAEYLFIDGETHNVAVADFTLGLNGAANGGVPFGFEVYVSAIEGEDFEIDPRLTGAVYYESSLGRLSVGLPRAALDDYLATASLGSSVITGIGIGTLFGSLTKTALLYSEASYEYGVRFDGSVKGLEFGLSYHMIEGLDAALTGALRLEFSEIYVATAGFEVIDEAGTDAGVFGSLVADYGIFGGLLSIASPTGSNEMIYSAEMFYEPSENIDLVTGYMSADSENLFSFDAEYTFMKNAYVGASVLGDFTGDPQYTLYAGWNMDFGS